MNIDRAAFLALTSALAMGCAASSGDDAVQNDEAAISAGGGDLCYSADESTQGYAKDYWVGKIGFDPVNDFPAAEGFCFDAASTGKKDANGFPEFDSYVYEKCNAYAKIYVPHVQYVAYANLKENLHTGTDVGAKWGALYNLDAQIAAEDFFCVDAATRLACRSAGDKPACLRAASQMIPEAKERLADCLEKFEAYSCIEGASQDLVPTGNR